jgi:hypothetical protein
MKVHSTVPTGTACVYEFDRVVYANLHWFLVSTPGWALHCIVLYYLITSPGPISCSSCVTSVVLM